MESFQLSGKWFKIDINQAQGNIILLNTDPSKQEYKPDAYPGKVTEVGPQCTLVKPGDQVVVERWEYSQWNLGGGIIVAREDDLLILNGEVPAHNVIVLHVLPEKTTALRLPDGTSLEENKKYWFGKIILSAYTHKDLDGELDIQIGDFVYVRKFDYQYCLGEHTLICRIKAECEHMYRDQDIIPLVLRPIKELSVV